ncbi:MAG TPA: urea ABC transporter permease subunit UrtB [Tepidisphaeraceae bacterium]|nr:urea ABC transporter permease subunit UrtB [Tepidisphaeraceae bacterium]
MVLLFAPAGIAHAAAGADGKAEAIAEPLKAAVRQLKEAKGKDREAIFAQLANAGDARLIPLLDAFRTGLLEDRDGALVIYGSKARVDGRDVYPLLDAFSAAPLTGADGKPQYAEKLPSGKNVLAASRGERKDVSAIVSALSLNDPDPARRQAAITEAGDRIDVALLPALKAQLEKDPTGRFATDLKESIARIELAGADRAARVAAARTLGQVGSERAVGSLQRAREANENAGDAELQSIITAATAKADRYQRIVKWVKITFDGLSLTSILVLLALGLSIVFGLMGVINMAHGEFMMVGAFTTFVVSNWFKTADGVPGPWFNYYPLAAVPIAFGVSAVVGLACEWLVVRHLYGRPLETLLATWGISLVLIQTARVAYGDTLSVTPPAWMVGGWEVAHDLILPRNRVFIIVFCLLCIVAVWLVVNRTKLGLLLRATTQNREMAAALGVATRRVDALTFAFGAGLAGLAGVVVPLFDKINPQMGQGYIVDSFMVVVVGGVGKLAGALVAGAGLGFFSKYLEPLISGTGAVIYGKIAVLVMVILFLQWRPAGLFPPKGRVADA